MPLNVCNSTIGFGSIKYNFFMSEFKREKNLIVYSNSSIFYASTIKNLFNANNRQNRPCVLKISKNVCFGYFAKAVAGKNGARIRHILLNLV